MGRGRHQQTQDLLDACVEILKEIHPCSVRAVAYRLFTRKMIEGMTKGEVAKVSRILVQAREGGEVPWEWIVDETRGIEQAPQYQDTARFMAVVKQAYRKDHWALQPRHVECWSEKGTVRGTVQPVLDEFGIGFRVLHGWASATALNEIAEAARASDKPWIVFYIGDFDPSGLHMSMVDLPDRLARYGSATIDLKRIALTKADVRRSERALPSFALETKQSDPRHDWYHRLTGGWTVRQGRCWEVDALSPTILRARLKAAIESVIESIQWARSVTVEKAEQDSLATYFAGIKSIVNQDRQ